jgi:hypothetical protein
MYRTYTKVNIAENTSVGEKKKNIKNLKAERGLGVYRVFFSLKDDADFSPFS